MSKRLDVITAVKAMIAAAAPHAAVIGLDGSDAAPKRVGPGGLIAVRSGDPGEPEVDLSPVAYHYDHRIPVEVMAPSEAVADALIVAIGAAVVADRRLGGVCDWLDTSAPETDDILEDGALPPRGAILTLVATYTTATPC